MVERLGMNGLSLLKRRLNFLLEDIGMVNFESAAVVVYGPSGCGKSQAADLLLKFFKKSELIDEWDGKKRLGKGVLALSNKDLTWADEQIDSVDMEKSLSYFESDVSRGGVFYIAFGDALVMIANSLSGGVSDLKYMTHHEREHLKRCPKDAESLYAIPHLIAHWMRQTKRVCFSDYAANWCVAHKLSTDGMRQHWPLVGERYIADGFSQWGTFKAVLA